MSIVRSWRSAVAAALLGLGPLFLFVVACYTAHPIARDAVKAAPPSTKDRVRLTFPTGNVILMPNWRLTYPYIEGEIDEIKGKVPGVAVDSRKDWQRFNLDEATLIESYQLSGWKVAGLTGGSVVGLAAALLVIVLLTSCPTVYVLDQGQQTVVGESYPGAIFRSVQRDDLLRIPLRDSSGRVTLRIQNNNNEVQYTDSAHLLVVDHSPNEVAVATSDGRIVLAGATASPTSARDLHDHDVTRLVANRDEQVWQSDLERGWRASRPDLREGIVATFASSIRADRLLLVRAENTVWLSVVFHRFFSMMGSSFDPILAAANTSDGPKVRAWEAREGVELRVEVMQDGRWVEVASIPTTGVTMMRDVAIPLAIPDDLHDGPLQVRLSAGYGFWRIDTISLAPLSADSPSMAVVSCSAAVTGTGHDETASILANDAAYQVLGGPGDRVDLTFDLPPASSRTRSVFLATRGYYNPLPPAPGMPQLATLQRIQNDTGGLVRFGRAFYEEHHAALREPQHR